jgi:hypothetical protein
MSTAFVLCISSLSSRYEVRNTSVGSTPEVNLQMDELLIMYEAPIRSIAFVLCTSSPVLTLSSIRQKLPPGVHLSFGRFFPLYDGVQQNAPILRL